MLMQCSAVLLSSVQQQQCNTTLICTTLPCTNLHRAVHSPMYCPALYYTVEHNPDLHCSAQTLLHCTAKFINVKIYDFNILFHILTFHDFTNSVTALDGTNAIHHTRLHFSSVKLMLLNTTEVEEKLV